MTSAEAEACRLVAAALGVQTEVGIADDMASLPAWDSLAHARLMLEIEAALERPLAAAEIGAVVSVRSVAEILERR